MSIPQAVIWEITRQCNFNCRHCLVDAFVKKPEDELTTEQAKAFIRNFGKIGGKCIFFSGGEPLLRKDLEEIIKYSASLGFSGFSIASNGTLVTKERIESLRAAGVTQIQFSLDGATPQKNALLRGGTTDNYRKIIDAVRIAERGGMTVTIGSFLCPDNIGDIPQLIEICKREKVGMLRFSGFIPFGRGRNKEVVDSMKFSIEQMCDFFRFIKKYDPAKTGVALGFDHAFGPFLEQHCCNAGNSIFYLSSKGDVYPCPSFLDESIKAGNIKDATESEIFTILSSDIMKSCQVSTEELTGRCRECPDVEWCRGGCRGVAFAYNGNMNSSFSNCLRDFRKQLGEIAPDILPDETAISLSSSKLYGSDAPSLKKKHKAGSLFDVKLLKNEQPVYQIYQENSPPYPVYNPLAALEMYYSAHSEMMKNQLDEHTLNYLLWESTLNCNFNCRHCSSPKERWNSGAEMTTEQVKTVFSKFADEFDVKQFQALGITGGEPALRKDLPEIASFLTRLGFKTAIDTNGFITGRNPDLISKLEQSGIENICISLDGLKKQFQDFRGVDGFNEAVNTIKIIVNKHPRIFVQTITMVAQHNINQLDEIFKLLENLGVIYARFGTVMSVGRAEEHDENFLSSEQLVKLFDWISEKRRDYLNGRTRLMIEFTDNGWCGRLYSHPGYEGAVRQGCFMCTAGINMGIITYDGKFGGCLSIDPKINIQGDLLTENPREIWENRFEVFRNKENLRTGACSDCTEWDFCMGGGMHERDENLVMSGCTFNRINRTHL
ncbi:MAG: radical SAM protein [Firmicutes bacterium]|nr:radical SAM protein [Bacillota bacterium]